VETPIPSFAFEDARWLTEKFSQGGGPEGMGEKANGFKRCLIAPKNVTFFDPLWSVSAHSSSIYL